MPCSWNEHPVPLYHDSAISANMKTGNLTPKCVPILATYFNVEDIDR